MGEACLDLAHLVSKLLLIVEILKPASPADGNVPAARRHPGRRGGEDLHGPGLRVLTPLPVDRCEHTVSREGILHEYDEPPDFGQGLSAEGEVGNGEIERLAAAGRSLVFRRPKGG